VFFFFFFFFFFVVFFFFFFFFFYISHAVYGICFYDLFGCGVFWVSFFFVFSIFSLVSLFPLSSVLESDLMRALLLPPHFSSLSLSLHFHCSSSFVCASVEGGDCSVVYVCSISNIHLYFIYIPKPAGVGGDRLGARAGAD